MAFRDTARGLLGGVQRFSNGVSGLLFPGFEATGVDPRMAQAAKAQAMMQMGAGLLGGQNFGQAYGLGQAAGYEPIEQARREAAMRAATEDRQSEAEYRRQQMERQQKLDQQNIVDRNRANMYRRFDKQEDAERWDKEFGLREDAARRQAAQEARLAESAALQAQAARATLERQAQEDAARRAILDGSYAEPGKSRGGGPGQRRTGGVTDPVERLIVQSGDLSDIVSLRNPPKDRDRQRTEIQLASDFATQSKEFNTVAQQYRRMTELAQKPSAANDFGLIYALAKINDPNSVVRESEFESAAKVGSYGAKVQAAVQRTANGQMLTPEQRADFLASAGNQYNAMRGQWEQTVVAPTRQRAENYGLDWNNIYRPYALPEQQQTFDDKPPASQHKGRIIEDDDGVRYRSDGMTWKPL